LLLVVVHYEETQAEQHREDAIHLAGKEPCEDVGDCLVAGQGVDRRIGRKDIEMLNGMEQDDADYGYAPEGVGHFDSGVG
jgi:hypothetical protein